MKWLAIVAMTAISFAAEAQSQSIPGLIAKRETAALSYEDKLAAYDAEQAVLAQRWNVQGFSWNGPDGSYGIIIATPILAMTRRSRPCRTFIHIVHHKDDGGANPTFQGRICLEASGNWVPQAQ